ncbi:restriction endonuclease subunit S [Methylicorpusculum sp.]|uniref:restriction endonuclease subunit S n=1 Tax=Methylicorpusculum sp. TaxID=2713644 RepID=UPI00272F5313|nr:restriction endonuclease subunit S [Methylicorpusculum sp.]MDP2177382.1 restriction endonuclease subunit S [Methylicorpusculum sp.]MDP3530971.1 restriction endonuclease subunit S [Methylicorpusculum sp.]MDZ4154435.1 restriction endonuclease subunit S [Methylicorpusculum sp.]
MSNPRNSSNSGATVANPEMVMDVQEGNAQYLLPAERQIPKGYKQTEVGVIPEDWDATKLGNFVSLQRGHDLTEYDRKSGEIPVMGSAGQNGFHETALVKGPGVVLGRSGASFGQAHYCEKDFWPHNTALYVTDFCGNDKLFAYYFLCALDFSRHNSGGAQQSLNRNFIAPVPVGVPPLTEQEAIAEALSDADALIEALEQLVAKKRQLKQGTMQELLTGKRRLPGFSGEWEIKQLGEIAHIKTGSRNNQDKVEDGEYPFFVRSATIERINSYSHECEAILVPGEGGIGSIFHYIDGRFDVHQRVYAITQFISDVSGKYVYLYMTMHFGVHAMQNSVKATVDSLRLPTFLEFEVKLPPTIKEQASIAQILTDMDSEIAELETKLTKARAVKQGMMQQLLTGRIRLL